MTDSGEWTVIKKSGGKVANSSKSKQIKRKSALTSALIRSAVEVDSSPVAVTKLREAVDKTIVALRKTEFYADCLSKFIEASNIDTSIEAKGEFYEAIVSLGIGNFSESQSSLLQLSFIICISEDLGLLENVFKKSIIFDPVMNELEIKVCDSYHLAVSTDNLKGKHEAITTNNKKTLFFMPHCPYRLYCNLLWQNWYKLSDIVIFGNSFSSYDLRRSETTSNPKLDCVKYLLVLTTESNVSMKWSKSSEYHFENAFNDLSIHSFNKDTIASTNLLIDRPTEELIDKESANDEELR